MWPPIQQELEEYFTQDKNTSMEVDQAEEGMSYITRIFELFLSLHLQNKNEKAFWNKVEVQSILL